MALCNQSAGMAHHTRWIKIENFDQKRVFRFRPLRQWSPCRIFYLFWAPNGRKLLIGLFDRRATKWCFWLACDQMVLSTGVRPNGAFDRRATKWCFWPACDQNLGSVLRSGETSDPYANSFEGFPPKFFTDFECPRAKNYKLLFLTIVRPKPGFGPFNRCVTISLSWHFWPMVQLMGGHVYGATK